MIGRAAHRLDESICAAHLAGDAAALSTLYAFAADDAAKDGDVDREGFFLTHALVFALDAGLPIAEICAERLRATGRHD